MLQNAYVTISFIGTLWQDDIKLQLSYDIPTLNFNLIIKLKYFLVISYYK